MVVVEEKLYVVMGKWGFLLLLVLVKICNGSEQHIGNLDPGFKGSQMYWIYNNGLFLLSNNSRFAFGLTTTDLDVTQFLLVMMQKSSSQE